VRRVWATFTAVAIGLTAWAWLSPSTDVAKVSTQKIGRVWSKTDSLAYARDALEVTAEKQFACLKNLWGKESGWDPSAYDKVKVMGMNAGGIPQVLGMSPHTPPNQQIDRGLVYIGYRYGTPCLAWRHWQRKGWY